VPPQPYAPEEQARAVASLRAAIGFGPDG